MKYNYAFFRNKIVAFDVVRTINMMGSGDVMSWPMENVKYENGKRGMRSERCIT